MTYYKTKCSPALYSPKSLVLHIKGGQSDITSLLLVELCDCAYYSLFFLRVIIPVYFWHLFNSHSIHHIDFTAAITGPS